MVSPKGIDDALNSGRSVHTLTGEDAKNNIRNLLDEANEFDPSPRRKKVLKALERLEGIEDKIRDDAGFHLEPDQLEQIQIIKESDPAEWVRLQRRLKKVDVNLRELNKALRTKAESQKDDLLSPETYHRQNGFLCWNRVTKEGPISTPLCNFDARIVQQEIRDDGLSTKTIFQIEGVLVSGQALPTACVPAEQFSGLNWVVKSWGTLAIVYAGSHIRDHLRTAIQVLSGIPETRTVYTHLGWRYISGVWHFLHSAGAITRDGSVGQDHICVDVTGDRLSDYKFPEIPAFPDAEQYRRPIDSSLTLLSLGSHELTYSLLAMIFRAPLCEMMPADFSVFIFGQTGTRKTSVASLFLSHFGAKFKGTNCPNNWSSTVNAIEMILFLAKDSPNIIDDFAPSGSQREVSALNVKAERVFRSQGNRTGRSRLNSDSSLKGQYYPRGVVIATGEDVPKGHSIRARLAILEVSRNDINLTELTRLQKLATKGVFGTTMALYIKFIATNWKGLKEKLLEKFEEFRNNASSELVSTQTHGRTPEIIANLALGLWAFSEFIKSHHPDGEVVSKILNSEHAWQTLLNMGRGQARFLDSEDPVIIFIELLNSVLDSGKCHIVDSISGREPPYPTLWGWIVINGQATTRGDKIGWIKDDKVMLIPDFAYLIVERFAKDQNRTLTLAPKTLWKRMSERGYLAETDKDHNTVQRMVEKKKKRVLVLHKSLFVGCEKSPERGVSPIIGENGESGDSDNLKIES